MSNLYKRRIGIMIIELIIVMSFTGVFIALSVPRYAGAIDNAKSAVDTQYVTLIGNASVALIADGTFKSGGTIEIASDGSVSSTGIPIAGFSDADIYSLCTKKPLSAPGITYTITVDGDGGYSIEIP